MTKPILKSGISVLRVWARLFLFRRCGGGGSFAGDQQHGLFILGAIVVHLLAKMWDEGAGRHRDCAVGIELATRAHPPRPFKHRNEAVIGMEMRTAHPAR